MLNSPVCRGAKPNIDGCGFGSTNYHADVVRSGGSDCRPGPTSGHADDSWRETTMPEVIFNGADGRLEGRYHHAPGPGAPLALILHPHPLHGGTMNNKVVFDVFHMFARRGFSVLRFNFRGVGRSQETFDHGQGELRDAAAASTGCSSTTSTAVPAGSPASRSAPGSACSS
jgi:hypothetical protein